ncbi:hypothetical protein AOLI_G00238230 [Acnodon oligacanthus]
MAELGKIIYPQVFDQRTASHVVTAVLYGAQTFMVFDRTAADYDDKQKVEGNLQVGCERSLEMAGKPKTMQEETAAKTPQEPPPAQKLKCSEDVLDVDYSPSFVSKTPTNLGPSSETSPKSAVEDFVRELKVSMQEVICKTASCKALSSPGNQDTTHSPVAEEIVSILSEVFKNSQPEDSPLTERTTHDVLREEQRQADSDLNGHSALDYTAPVCSVERLFSVDFKTQATQTLSDILLKTGEKLSASESKQSPEAFCLTDFQPKVYALLEEEEVAVTPSVAASPLPIQANSTASDIMHMFLTRLRKCCGTKRKSFFSAYRNIHRVVPFLSTSSTDIENSAVTIAETGVDAVGRCNEVKHSEMAAVKSSSEMLSDAFSSTSITRIPSEPEVSERIEDQSEGQIGLDSEISFTADEQMFYEAIQDISGMDSMTLDSTPSPLSRIASAVMEETLENLVISREESLSDCSSSISLNETRTLNPDPVAVKKRGLGIFCKKAPVFRFALKKSVYPAGLVSDDHPATSSSGNLQNSSQRELKILMSPLKKTRKHLSRMFFAISKALPNPFKCMTPPS